MRRKLVAFQAVYYLATGFWPLIHLASFEAVTGPKTEDWLVKMVGLLAVAVGITLGTAAGRNQVRLLEVVVLAMTSAVAFAAIDLWYGLTGRISPVYLADAAIELGLIAGLALTRRRESPVVG